MGLEAEQNRKYLPWIYLGVFLLVTAGCYAVLQYVVPMGDDLFYWTRGSFWRVSRSIIRRPTGVTLFTCWTRSCWVRTGASHLRGCLSRPYSARSRST